MREVIRLRLDQARQVWGRPWVRRTLGGWAAICIYDTAGSQFLPPSWQSKRPTAYTVIEMTTGWLPLWLWLLIGALIAVVASLEYAHRVQRRVTVPNGGERPASLADDSDQIARPAQSSGAGENGEWIPLTEAARRACEVARGSMHATAAEKFADSADDVLLWFATYLRERADLYGCLVPSRKLERVDMAGFRFEAVDGEITAKEDMGARRWVGLVVRPDDLDRVTESLPNSMPLAKQPEPPVAAPVAGSPILMRVGHDKTATQAEMAERIGDWRKLWSIADDNQSIRLNFFPDTKQRSADAVLLVVYGYELLLSATKVPARAVSSEMQRALHAAPGSPLSPMLRLTGTVYSALGEKTDCGSYHLERGNLERVDLSRGGSYQLTADGESHAFHLAWDAIKRA